MGNWFSNTDYFEVKSIEGDNITTICDKKDVVISRDILEHDMHNAGVFTKTEKLPLTKVVKELNGAHSTAFTINFNTKVDQKEVEEKLASISEKEFKDAKTLSKAILLGPEKTFVGRLTK